MKTATCHTDRKHRAKGYCESCYIREYNKERKKDPNFKKPSNKIKAKCHPDRPHMAKGLCHACYMSKHTNPKRTLKYHTDKNYRKIILEQKKDYEKKHPERCRIVETKSRIKKQYGITKDKYDLMYSEQNGKCILCNKSCTSLFEEGHRSTRLCIDHNHITGKVRELLCGECNRKLSALEDFVWKEKAENYLMLHSRKEVA